MFSFRSRFAPRPPGSLRTRPARPRLEALEERTLLNNRFVVPVGVPVDNTVTFASLQAALTTGAHSAGEIIQIEPGATPGDVTAANLAAPAVANLTLQGDPNAALATIPLFTVSDTAVVPVGPAESGFTLRNVNVGLVAAGALTFTTNVTITGSSLVDINSSATFAVSFNPGAASNVVSSVTNSTLTTLVGGINLVVAVPGSGTGDTYVFANDTFVASNTTGGGGVLLAYFAPAANPSPVVTDQVINNTFLGNPGSNLSVMFNNRSRSSGVTLQGNTFSDPDPGVTGINLTTAGLPFVQSTVVQGNTVRLTGAGAVGIAVAGGNTNSVETATLTGNQVSTSLGANGGTGLTITGPGQTSTTVNVLAQDNDFHANAVGVEVILTAFSVPQFQFVDLGGVQSGGGNNFRLIPVANAATQGAIVVTGTNPSAADTIFAEGNLFGGATGNVFIAAGLTNATVDTTNPLAGNAAFVESLYETFLKRFSDTANAADAGFWVNQLNGGAMTPAQVAAAISRAPEALGVLVDGLYAKILGRAADAGGRNNFVGFLQHGGTAEQATALLLTSPEYAALAGSDFGFVQSLYIKLLGRTGSNNEVASWLGLLPGVGRAAAANAFLTSAEFRTAVVQELYGFVRPPAVSVASLFYPLLHRAAAPPAGEVAFWVNSGLDLLTVETAFAQTGEFFATG